MANKKEHLTDLFKLVKVKKFINAWAKDHDGNLPEMGDIPEEVKTIMPEEEAKIDAQVKADNLAKLVDATTTPAEFDYIVDESSWNASYANGALKDYYVWADGLSPYKEDLWNEKEQRPANWNDIVKENGVPVEFEDGYHYEDSDGNPCVRCWKGAFNAPGAAYPWCAVKFQPFYGAIELEYEGEKAYPWGQAFRQFKRTFGIESIPNTFGSEYKSDFEGNTSFDPSKLSAILYK